MHRRRTDGVPPPTNCDTNKATPPRIDTPNSALVPQNECYTEKGWKDRPPSVMKIPSSPTLLSTTTTGNYW
eukprot:scaffold18052_cov175-Amphora_coffeaeformis.AAC.6